MIGIEAQVIFLHRNSLVVVEGDHPLLDALILEGHMAEVPDQIAEAILDGDPCDLRVRIGQRVQMHQRAHVGIDEDMARDLVKIGQKVRNLRGHGLEEGVSTRLLIYAAQMIAKGISPIDAAEVAICSPITDDRELQRSIREIVTTII